MTGWKDIATAPKDGTELLVWAKWDWAAMYGDDTDPDRTAHGVWGVDQDLNLYLLDGWRGRRTADIWAAEWLRLCKKWKPLMALPGSNLPGSGSSFSGPRSG